MIWNTTINLILGIFILVSGIIAGIFVYDWTVILYALSMFFAGVNVMYYLADLYIKYLQAQNSNNVSEVSK